jgi:hypothetical protein
MFQKVKLSANIYPLTSAGSENPVGSEKKEINKVSPLTFAKPPGG